MGASVFGKRYIAVKPVSKAAVRILIGGKRREYRLRILAFKKILPEREIYGSCVPRNPAAYSFKGFLGKLVHMYLRDLYYRMSTV